MLRVRLREPPKLTVHSQLIVNYLVLVLTQTLLVSPLVIVVQIQMAWPLDVHISVGINLKVVRSPLRQDMQKAYLEQVSSANVHAELPNS